MKKRLFAALAAVALVSGCASTATVENEDDASAFNAQQYEQQNEDFAKNAKDRVFFGFDKSNLSAEAIASLKAQSEWLNANPDKEILIEGHTDDRGTRDYNLALGERRAIAVKNYLMSRGVNPDNIKTVSYGKERPAVVGANESAWAQNRRAVTKIKN